MFFDYSLSLDEFRASLKQTGYQRLAEHLWDNSNLKSTIDSHFLQAIQQYFTKRGLAKQTILNIQNQLQSYPILQTAHHVTPTNGPTFLGIDMLSLWKKPKDLYYLVAANSGVSFSNTAWSGALSFGEIPLEMILKKESASYQQSIKAMLESQKQSGSDEKKLNLILSKYRDALLYNKQIETIINQNYQAFQYFYHDLPQLADYQYYVDWSIQVCMQIQQTLFDDQRIIYFDANTLVVLYLITVLQQTAHPIISLMFEIEDKKQQLPPLFVQDKIKKSYYKTETVDLRDIRENYSKNDLIVALEEKKLAPSSFLLYFVFNGLQNICCLGSFLQYQYIQSYIQIWDDYFPEMQIQQRKSGLYRYSYYRAKSDGKAIYPFDLYMQKKAIDLKKQRFFCVI